MVHGIEVRVPFLDPDLVGFATRLPTAWKQRGRQGKAIFKRAMEPLLPRDVIYRPKTGFGVPLRRWLRHELREPVRDLLAAPVLRRRGWFDADGVDALLRGNEAGEVDGGYLILALLCVEIWARLFVDDAAPAPWHEQRHAA
jgi:asparagine synthase (glutamine-hydrolysing)